MTLPDREKRALKLVEDHGVKLHKFIPSKREIWSVVGSEGDLLVVLDLRGGRHSFCSCGDFHFRVMSGTVPECYHLIAARNAIREGKYSTTEFPDEDYREFLKALLDDILSHTE